ncbi:hypothetical protein SCHPADRAFT_895768 [Schizopora paradoxa]|uniref:Uncharacterized protein n=1 Tax=Schizopora paradoxa TaxID=27342 RepID=A0A0H2R2S5_9AGAM|nr:hypothetical protein SCHPADRAFT_895768 [Schizopora paradoxa]
MSEDGSEPDHLKKEKHRDLKNSRIPVLVTNYKAVGPVTRSSSRARGKTGTEGRGATHRKIIRHSLSSSPVSAKGKSKISRQSGPNVKAKARNKLGTTSRPKKEYEYVYYMKEPAAFRLDRNSSSSKNVQKKSKLLSLKAANHGECSNSIPESGRMISFDPDSQSTGDSGIEIVSEGHGELEKTAKGSQTHGDDQSENSLLSSESMQHSNEHRVPLPGSFISYDEQQDQDYEVLHAAGHQEGDRDASPNITNHFQNSGDRFRACNWAELSAVFWVTLQVLMHISVSSISTILECFSFLAVLSLNYLRIAVDPIPLVIAEFAVKKKKGGEYRDGMKILSRWQILVRFLKWAEISNLEELESRGALRHREERKMRNLILKVQRYSYGIPSTRTDSNIKKREAGTCACLLEAPEPGYLSDSSTSPPLRAKRHLFVTDGIDGDGKPRAVHARRRLKKHPTIGWDLSNRRLIPDREPQKTTKSQPGLCYESSYRHHSSRDNPRKPRLRVQVGTSTSDDFTLALQYNGGHSVRNHQLVTAFWKGGSESESSNSNIYLRVSLLLIMALPPYLSSAPTQVYITEAQRSALTFSGALGGNYFNQTARMRATVKILQNDIYWIKSLHLHQRREGGRRKRRKWRQECGAGGDYNEKTKRGGGGDRARGPFFPISDDPFGDFASRCVLSRRWRPFTIISGSHTAAC